MSSIDKQTKDIPLVTIQIKRVIDGTTKLFVKSEIFETFFSTFGISDQFRDAKQNIREIYKTPQMESRDTLNRALQYNNFNSLKNDDGYYNYCFIRAKGLTDGIEFKITGLHSKQAIKKWKEEFKKNCSEFYQQYMMPETHDLEILVRSEVKN